MKKRALIVELNAYHGEVLPGFTCLFQACGYKVDLLIRNEVADEDPFVRYPQDLRPKIIAKKLAEIVNLLKSGFAKEYDIVFFSTNVLWEKGLNFSSIFRFLGFVPVAREGAIYVEHNLSSIEADDSTELYRDGKIVTLLPYPLFTESTRMVNPHYFGTTRLTKKRSIPRIVVVGSSSFHPYSLDLIYYAIRKNHNLKFEVVLAAGRRDISVPEEISDKVRTVGRMDFQKYYNLLEEADYLLTVFPSNNLENDKYLNGTTSGTVQASLGFRKPMIIDEVHAKRYGFTSADSIVYEQGKLARAIEEAIKLDSKAYDRVTASIDEKSKLIFHKSKENLAAMLAQNLAADKKNEELLMDQVISTVKNKELIEKIRLENDNLRGRIKKHELTISALKSKLEKQYISAAIHEERENDYANQLAQARKRNVNSSKAQTILKHLPGIIKIISLSQTENGLQKREINRNARIIKKSGLLDEGYYRAVNPDVAKSGIDPITHYATYGYLEGRDPSPSFDQEYYLASNPDVKAAGLNPLVHYIAHGQQEGRQPSLPEEYTAFDGRIPIAFQVGSFDRGGLEEVVLTLASDTELNKKYKVFVFVEGSSKGYIADIARSKGVVVFGLGSDRLYLDFLIKRLAIKLCNLHYSLFAVGTYKKRGVKLVYTIHNNYIWADNSFVSAREADYDQVDRFVAVSSQVADFFSQRFSIAREKIDVITNGINIKTIDSITPQDRRNYGIKEGDYVFVNVASFTPNKYHASLVVAFSKVAQRFPRVKLLLVGNVLDKEYFDVIKKLISKYGISDKVVISDFVPKPQLMGILSIADCFIMPSLTEGFSIASLEAMYSKLPIITTDVGGARHIIKHNDGGIIVNNAYTDIHSLNSDVIKENYVDDSQINNLDNIVSAMVDMIKHKAEWKNKALKLNKRVLNEFQDFHVVAQYAREFNEILTENYQKLILQIDSLTDRYKIAIVAPFPSSERVTEGWMSRINAIDRIVGLDGRIYINVTNTNNEPVLVQMQENGWELNIGFASLAYPILINRLISKINVVYVHTLHLAEYMLPWLGSGKIIVDFHGITPEEEVMMGRSFLVSKYERVEEKVLRMAKICVMVTGAMKRHYTKKYPAIKNTRTIVLPIVEDIPLSKKTKLVDKQTRRVVYAGGTQAWQNVHSMLEIAKLTEPFAEFTFLSHDWRSISSAGKATKVPEKTIYRFCEKRDLRRTYEAFDFGLVLRDETAVNTVACPTKLYEYMRRGLLPIVRTASMGDFMKLGYQYILEIDFVRNKLPSEARLEKMLQTNYNVTEQMIAIYKAGSKQLRSEVRKA